MTVSGRVILVWSMMLLLPGSRWVHGANGDAAADAALAEADGQADAQIPARKFKKSRLT